MKVFSAHHLNLMFNLVIEARNLWKQGIIELQGVDKELFEKTDLGTVGLYEGD